tara:strand:+ start:1986 stop:2150 length:165 start_codon:yes stop_codon:yes gene_type:complete
VYRDAADIVDAVDGELRTLKGVVPISEKGPDNRSGAPMVISTRQSMVLVAAGSD